LESNWAGLEKIITPGPKLCKPSLATNRSSSESGCQLSNEVCCRSCWRLGDCSPRGPDSPSVQGHGPTAMRQRKKKSAVRVSSVPRGAGKNAGFLAWSHKYLHEHTVKPLATPGGRKENGGGRFLAWACGWVGIDGSVSTRRIVRPTAGGFRSASGNFRAGEKGAVTASNARAQLVETGHSRGIAIESAAGQDSEKTLGAPSCGGTVGPGDSVALETAGFFRYDDWEGTDGPRPKTLGRVKSKKHDLGSSSENCRTGSYWGRFIPSS